MALPHAASGEIIDIRPLGVKIAESPSIALVRTEHIELLRLVLLAGKTVPEHRAPGEVVLQCLDGAIELHAHGASQTMHPGELLYLAIGEPYSMRAIENASVLMTLCLKHTG